MIENTNNLDISKEKTLETQIQNNIEIKSFIESYIENDVIKYRLIIPKEEKKDFHPESLTLTLSNEFEGKQCIKQLTDSIEDFLNSVNRVRELENGDSNTALVFTKSIFQNLNRSHKLIFERYKQAIELLNRNKEIFEEKRTYMSKGKFPFIGSIIVNIIGILIGVILYPKTLGVSFFGYVSSIGMIVSGLVLIGISIFLFVIFVGDLKDFWNLYRYSKKNNDKLEIVLNHFFKLYRNLNDELINSLLPTLSKIYKLEKYKLGVLCYICETYGVDPVILPCPQDSTEGLCKIFCKKCIMKRIETKGTNPFSEEPLTFDQLLSSERDTIFVKNQIQLAQDNGKSIYTLYLQMKNRKLGNFKTVPPHYLILS